MFPSTPAPVRDLAGEHALITLAQETGGKYYYADSSSLDKTFAQVSEDLRTQYLLGYYPSNRTGSAFRTISVKLRGQPAILATTSAIALATIRRPLLRKGCRRVGPICNTIKGIKGLVTFVTVLSINLVRGLQFPQELDGLWLPLSAVLLCLGAGSAYAGVFQSQPQNEAVSVLPDDPEPQANTGQNPPVTPTPTRANRQSLPQINQREADQSDDQENPAVFSHHLIVDRIWISGQANFIFQAHEPFHSPYSGTNSFKSRVETTALSRVLTLYTGVKLTRWFEFIFNAEEAGGKGLSEGPGDCGVHQS